ncbi:hypothetical protein SAMN06295905_1885 [Devosia lucknowensis]|uniref:DUF3828 domain-containing protein n=1 Tax=Devosia lucknowensis TaxID=1096929 RepID=A0A1Y6F9Q2_9HYPH|nr:hypothetical protein [Devosia lucknowensis]SMQ70321.1 hypothetical protein SAMN06295905_1885 [Devosia lucknowensis]
MRPALAIAILPISAALAGSAQAQMATIEPAQVGQIFCIGSLGNDMTPVAAMLTADLRTVIEMAIEANTAFELAHPGDKPPLGDGLPWRSFPDYADGCSVGAVSEDVSTATVEIHYTFSDATDASYSDTLLLLSENFEPDMPHVWRVDDVQMVGGNSMRALLDAAFAADAAQ